MGNETSEMWHERKREKQQLHADWKRENTDIMISSGVPFEDKGETFLIREKGMPKVDFYPSTGRWKADGKYYRGGARAFLKWYKKQRSRS